MNLILEALESVGFNWHVAVLNFFNFLIILLILNKFVFKKLGKVIDQRDDLIRKGLQNAEEAGKMLHTAEEEKMKIVHDAKVEAKALIDAGTSKGESVARDISLKAQHDADALRGRLSDEIKNAKDSVEEEFSKSAPAHIANILESILGKNINPEINQDFIKSQLSIMK